MKITKQSGEKEDFSKNKFCKSLREAGAPKKLTEEACEKISSELHAGMTTSQIFRKASSFLVKRNATAAARYNLKRGINGLGPAGFLFERYLEALLRAEGYTTKRNKIMRGKCVSHEIDILAHKEKDHALVEAKYRNDQGAKTHVDVVMYADARLVDIAKKRTKQEKSEASHRMWVITNTKFTGTAQKYAKCRNIDLTGWDYPRDASLEKLVAKHALYPITVLPSVDKHAREQFSKHNMMLAQDIVPHSEKDLQKKFGIQKPHAERILREARGLVYGENGEAKEKTSTSKNKGEG